MRLKTILSVVIGLVIPTSHLTVLANDALKITDTPLVYKIPLSATNISDDWLNKRAVYINVNTSSETRIPLEVLIGQLEVAGLPILSDEDLSNVFYSGENIHAGETSLSVIKKISSNTGLDYRVNFPDGKKGVVVLSKHTSSPNVISSKKHKKPRVQFSAGECTFTRKDSGYISQQGKHFFNLKKGTLASNVQQLIHEAFPNYRFVNKVGHHMVFNDVCLFATTRDELIQKIIEPYSSPKRLYFATFTNKVGALFYEGDKVFSKYFRGRN